MNLNLIISIILFPFCAFAHLTKATNLLEEGYAIVDGALHYEVFSLENQPVTLGNIFIGLVSLIIGLKIAKHLGILFKKKLFSIIGLDNNSANLMGRIVDYVFMAIVIIIALDIAKVPVTIFTFIGGAFVVSIGLSSQHLINNFISGIALIIESKIKVGDLVEYQGIIGRVESIEARMVVIKTQDNIGYFIPHSKLMQEHFSNWNYVGNNVRVATHIKIDQKDNINNDFETIVLNAVIQNRNILATPRPQILLSEFDCNILHYEINFWVNLANIDRKRIISEVNNNILNALRAHHIPLGVQSRRYVE